jgi:hypothetical protein
VGQAWVFAGAEEEWLRFFGDVGFEGCWNGVAEELLSSVPVSHRSSGRLFGVAACVRLMCRWAVCAPWRTQGRLYRSSAFCACGRDMCCVVSSTA